MKSIKKKITTTIQIDNADEIISKSKYTKSLLDDFIDKTEDIKSNQITACIELEGLKKVNIKYDVEELINSIEYYRIFIKKIDDSMESFINEVGNMKLDLKSEDK